MTTCHPLRSLWRHVLAFAVLGTLSSFGQELLHKWDFRQGVGNWYAAHSCAPLAVAGGNLLVRANGPDPYIHSSEGTDFTINARRGVFIRMRARCNVRQTAEFFWAETPEGPNAGFAGGKEVRFRMHGDGEFHTYNVFPNWQGRVARLRFDPPGTNELDATVEIASIEILALPDAPATGGPSWQFAGSLAGFVPGDFVEDVRAEPEAVVVTGVGPTVSLISPPLTLNADDYAWLTLDAEASSPVTVAMRWQDGDGKYSRDRASLLVPTGKSHHTVKLTRFTDWQGPLSELRLQWQADTPTDLRIRALTLGKTPAGPAQYELLSLGTDRAFTPQGIPVTIQAQFRNTGGTTMPQSQIAVTSQNRVLGRLDLPSVAPGEIARTEVRIPVSGIGEHALQIALPGDATPCAVDAVIVPALPQRAPAGRGASIDASQAVLSSGTTRLRAPAHPGGRLYGPLYVEVLRDNRWQQVAVLPACGGLQTGTAPHRELPWGAAEAASGTGLVFTTTYNDATGKQWQSTGTYSLTEKADRIAMQHTLKSLSGGDVLRYDGPVVRVGDGTFGARKYEALFPGLEYLSADEVSSSDRDIHPPQDLRAIPHPNRVCIPAMAIASPDRDLVALLWDNRQHWLDEHDQPSAVFASPNFVESHDPRVSPSAPLAARARANHLLGLFAPSIPAFLEENDVRARTPVALAANDTITLRSVLLVRPHGEVLDAVTEWLDLAPPPPIGDPPLPLHDHYALSMRAFEEILYTEGKGWANVKGWEPGISTGTALLYLYMADRLQRPDIRRISLERSGKYAALPFALHTGTVAQAVLSMRNGSSAALGRREPDGNWVFHPSEKTACLGKEGDTNVGMAAGHVRQIMRGAAQTADEHLLQQGLVGLEWIRKWRVPRGAQVWEIPLHAPDILASAHCCAAFLWGYRLTGDESYLEDAVYWARTGLPFVYFWQTPEAGLEPMRGGTIPIFGATFYVGSWYGRLVQWCGLEYARVLIDLAPYDQSHDWRAVARDITVSGWRQQQTKEGFQGLYPDSWSMLNGGISWGLMLGPARLLSNQLTLDGFSPYGDTRLFRRGKSQVALLGPGKFLDVSVGTEGDGTHITELPDSPFRLDFTHQFQLVPDCWIALVGVGKSARVEIDGATVPQVADLANVASGWNWSPSMPGLVVKLHSPERKPVTVAIHGLSPAPPRRTRTTWTFDRDPEGWTPDHGLAPLAVENGILTCTPVGDDPYLCVRFAELNTARYPKLRIRCRTPADAPMQVFWGTTDGGFSPARSASAALRGGNVWQTVEIDLAANPTWRRGAIALRIDPPDGGLEIDEIRFAGPKAPAQP